MNYLEKRAQQELVFALMNQLSANKKVEYLFPKTRALLDQNPQVFNYSFNELWQVTLHKDFENLLDKLSENIGKISSTSDQDLIQFLKGLLKVIKSKNSDLQKYSKQLVVEILKQVQEKLDKIVFENTCEKKVHSYVQIMREPMKFSKTTV